MQKITTFLTFKNQAKNALNFYKTVLKAKVTLLMRYE